MSSNQHSLSRVYSRHALKHGSFSPCIICYAFILDTKDVIPFKLVFAYGNVVVDQPNFFNLMVHVLINSSRAEGPVGYDAELYLSKDNILDPSDFKVIILQSFT